MLIYLLAFVVGVLTIPSPRILRVLPFVFGRADQPFRRSRLPLKVGMALTFFRCGNCGSIRWCAESEGDAAQNMCFFVADSISTLSTILSGLQVLEFTRKFADHPTSSTG
jgi:hypothetical protein